MTRRMPHFEVGDFATSLRSAAWRLGFTKASDHSNPAENQFGEGNPLEHGQNYRPVRRSGSNLEIEALAAEMQPG